MKAMLFALAVLGLMASPIAAQPALTEEPDAKCAVERVAVAQCPLLLPDDLAQGDPAEEAPARYGETRIRGWRASVTPDTTLYVYLGRVDGTRAVYSPRRVPILASCVGRYLPDRAMAHYIRAPQLVPADRRVGGQADAWFVEVRLPGGPAGVTMAIELRHLRMVHWPVEEGQASTAAADGVGAVAVREKIRGRRERMHAGVN